MSGTWTKLTVFDVLPEDCRDGIGDRNYGDLSGDVFFSVKDVYLPKACEECKRSPMQCMHKTAGASLLDCLNPESGGNLVVRKIEVEVKQFGPYEVCLTSMDKCDYRCEKKGTALAGITKKLLLPKLSQVLEPDNGGDTNSSPGTAGPVGRASVFAGNFMAPHPQAGFLAPSNDFEYWTYNIARKLNKGYWYSLEQVAEGRYWRHERIIKTISKSCQALWLVNIVQQRGMPCFSKCVDPLDQRSACWIRCFFETVLGQRADSTTNPDGGMTVEEIASAWTSGFDSENMSIGGCPPCPAVGPCSLHAGQQPSLVRPMPVPSPSPPPSFSTNSTPTSTSTLLLLVSSPRTSLKQPFPEDILQNLTTTSTLSSTSVPSVSSPTTSSNPFPEDILQNLTNTSTRSASADSIRSYEDSIESYAFMVPLLLAAAVIAACICGMAILIWKKPWRATLSVREMQVLLVAPTEHEPSELRVSQFAILEESSQHV